MSSFCTKCGAAITPDLKFCPVCGTATDAAPVATPSPAAAEVGYQAVSPVAYPAAPNSGGSALKIILIIVAVFIGLGIAVAGIIGFAAWRVTRAVHIENDGDKVTVHTAGGTISTNASNSFTASELGVDPYPGATTGHGSMKMNLPTGSMVTGIFLTSDSKDKVIDFYKNKFGSEASVIDTPSGAMITMIKDQKESVIVTVTTGSSENDGKTQISIVHTKSNKSS